MIRRLVWLLLVLVLVPSPAWAQPSAVDLAKDAKSHYDRGEWADALRLFDEAEALAHSPVLVLYAARCHRNLDNLLRARELLQRVADEKLPPDAPTPFVNAQKDARADLEAIAPRIPKIAIDRRQAPAPWVVEVDGKSITTANIEVDPGAHIVTAKEGDVVRFREEVQVTDGATVTVTILDTGGAAVPDPTPAPDPNGDATSTGSAADLAPGLVVMGLGAVGLAIGVALRVVAIQNVEDVKGRCEDGSCLREDEAVIDDAVTFQNVSTVLFIVGGAAVATGIVLLIVLPGDDTAVSVGPTGMALRGTF